MSDNKQKNENRETVADIVADIRERAYNATRHGERITDNYAVSELLKSIAANIEAAWKREREEVEADALEVGGIVEAARTAEKSSAVGNAAAMREALVTAKKAICHHAEYVCERLACENGNTQSNCIIMLCAHRDLCEAKTAINDALSAPLRNCDVGTVEEQGDRQKAYCRKHFTPDNLGGNCRKCPLNNRKGWSCQIAWAQMPYEQEGVEK